MRTLKASSMRLFSPILRKPAACGIETTSRTTTIRAQEAFSFSLIRLKENASCALIVVVRLVVSIPQAAGFRSIGEKSLILDAFNVRIAETDLVASEVPSFRRPHFCRESTPLRAFSDRDVGEHHRTDDERRGRRSARQEL